MWTRVFFDKNDGGGNGGAEAGANGAESEAGSGNAGGAESPKTESLLDRASPKEADTSESAKLGEEADENERAKADGGAPRSPAPGLKFDTRPEFLPDQFFDASTGEVRLETLTKAWKDQRDEVKRVKAGKFGEVPESPSDYKIEVPEDLQEIAGRVFIPDQSTGEDPLVTQFRDFAHAEGMGNEEVNKTLAWYLKTQAATLPDKIDQDAEMAKLGPRAQQLIDATDAFGEAMKANGQFDDAMSEEYRLTASSANGVRMLNAIRDHYGERPVPTQLQAAAAAKPDAGALQEEMGQIMRDLKAGKITDTEAQRRSEALEAKFEAHYGKAPASDSMVVS